MSENIDVGIIMGSQSDWETMKNAQETLEKFNIKSEARVISAHRTPKRCHDYVANAKKRGLKAIIAGAGGAAHLAGVAASLTTIPILGVPMLTTALAGADSLYSTVQMPKGIPVATFAIGKAGAINAALFAVQIIALQNHDIQQKLIEFKQKQETDTPQFPQ